MNEYFIIVVLGLWLLYDIIMFILYRKKVSYNFILTFLFILGYIYLHYFDNEYIDYIPIFELVLVSLFILILFIQGIIRNFKKDLTEEDFKLLENELKNIKKTSELLRMRFVSTIEIFNDGISFQEDDISSFGTDKFIEIIEIVDKQGPGPSVQMIINASNKKCRLA